MTPIEAALAGVWLMLPALIPNSAAVLFGGGGPMDLGKSWRGKRVLGDGKTWRGFFGGSLAGAAFGLLQIGIAEAIYGVGGGLFWPANTSTIMSSAPPRRYGVASGVMNTFRNTGMVMSFALSLVAATSVIPAAYVYKLFIGTLTGGLPPGMATAYLAGQSFAFEVSIALLAVAAVISMIRGKLPTHAPTPGGEAAASAADGDGRD